MKAREEPVQCTAARALLSSWRAAGAAQRTAGSIGGARSHDPGAVFSRWEHVVQQMGHLRVTLSPEELVQSADRHSKLAVLKELLRRAFCDVGESCTKSVILSLRKCLCLACKLHRGGHQHSEADGAKTVLDYQSCNQCSVSCASPACQVLNTVCLLFLIVWMHEDSIVLIWAPAAYGSVSQVPLRIDRL